MGIRIKSNIKVINKGKLPKETRDRINPILYDITVDIFNLSSSWNDIIESNITEEELSKMLLLISTNNLSGLSNRLRSKMEENNILIKGTNDITEEFSNILEPSSQNIIAYEQSGILIPRGIDVGLKPKEIQEIYNTKNTGSAAPIKINMKDGRTLFGNSYMLISKVPEDMQPDDFQVFNRAGIEAYLAMIPEVLYPENEIRPFVNFLPYHPFEKENKSFILFLDRAGRPVALDPKFYHCLMKNFGKKLFFYQQTANSPIYVFSGRTNKQNFSGLVMPIMTDKKEFDDGLQAKLSQVYPNFSVKNLFAGGL